ncbi:MAG: ATP-binding protein [Clostridia bacterium]|nr:ATP-binding protein [Clostridia bacterium]
MDYQTLNEIQKKNMNCICINDYCFDWENPEFIDILLGKLPTINGFYYSDHNISEDVFALERLLKSYVAFSTDKNIFLERIKEQISNIKTKNDRWHGVYLSEIEMCLDIHKFCLISGEGGIGKSYLVKCFEQKLEDLAIPHLCVYGKFEKDIGNIDFIEIQSVKNGFVFVVDAVNEMTLNGQQKLLEQLKILKDNQSIRIVITYRNGSLTNETLKSFRDLATYEYPFSGVSFESAMDAILKKSIPDVYKFEDILYSNNALFLNMLGNVLANGKIVDETINSVASVTYILERYIKVIVEKTFKKHMNCNVADIWRDTKRIAQWMYTNNTFSINEADLLAITSTGDEYINIMIQVGILGSINVERTIIYYFLVDSMSDYLIARSLFDDIKNKSFDEQVSTIKDKTNGFHSFSEAVIIALFDNLSPNYAYIKDMLEATDMLSEFTYDIIVKIRFNRNNIESFLKIFKPSNPEKLLLSVGGYTDKPFNCENYLKSYYSQSMEKAVILSRTLEFDYANDSLLKRLKNMIYFIVSNERNDRRDTEAYYFALLCSASSNNGVRTLSEKLLYEVVNNNEKYISNLVSDYFDFEDYYIKETIIHVLSMTKKNNRDVISFFEKIIQNSELLGAKSIRRTATYLGNPYGYIEWTVPNLYKYCDDASISNYMDRIIMTVDSMNKDFLPFRYFGKDNINMNTKFISTEKNVIKKINTVLADKYSCVKNGVCNGWITFDEKIGEDIPEIANVSVLDTNSFFESYEKIIKKVFSEYCITESEFGNRMTERHFFNSLFLKCIDIATDIYYGSLMCNYYTDSFATFNNYQESIGYEVYDPLKYGEQINLASPVPIFHSQIEMLETGVIENIQVPGCKDLDWVKDSELSQHNILSMLKSVEVNNTTWVLLAGRISLHKSNEYKAIWKDDYEIWCCTDMNKTIQPDGNARYLTIELNDYYGRINDYADESTNPSLCTRVRPISPSVELIEDTSLVLPPSTIISFFDLRFKTTDSSWHLPTGETVVVCNNKKNSYYEDPIGSTVFIKKEYLEQYLKTNSLKYFAFSERLIQETGYVDETSLHYEICEGKIIKIVKNSDFEKSKCQIPQKCKSCSINEKRNMNISSAILQGLINQFEMND